MNKEDLLKITWDYSSNKKIGIYGKDEEGNDINIYISNFVAVDAKNPKDVVRCNLEEEWIEELKDKDPYKYASCLGDPDLSRYRYTGRIQIKEKRSNLFSSESIYELRK